MACVFGLLAFCGFDLCAFDVCMFCGMSYGLRLFMRVGVCFMLIMCVLFVGYCVMV